MNSRMRKSANEKSILNDEGTTAENQICFKEEITFKCWKRVKEKERDRGKEKERLCYNTHHNEWLSCS